MAISKQKKDELVEHYKAMIEQSHAIFITEYTGMSVKDMEELRSEAREAEGQFTVTKNTLMQLALSESNYELPDEFMIGQLATGFAMGEAPAMAKVLVDMAKEKDEKLALKGALLGERFLSVEEIKQLAALPSLDQLRAQFLGLLGNPAQGIASVLATSVRQVVNVVDAYARSGEEAVE